MTKIAIIAGTGLTESSFFSDYKHNTVKTEWGDASVYTGDIIFVQRHGISKTVPPHKINYKANIAAVRKLGADKIISICSVGSLSKKMPPGSLFFPDDFFSPFSVPTYHDDKCVHVVPEISSKLKSELRSIAESLNVKFFENGVYASMSGPRFETPSEIKWLSGFCDVVGMTAGNEIPLANEFSIPYGLVCMVDNYANGIGKKLTFEELKYNVKNNTSKIEELLKRIVRKL
ncbi:MAG: MTAP family purine nucleoside phosphorylase [Verrucomicrobiota bacterium]|nr:MTAP family purine nucleoside phosphorylase [Verrucomicrobiota bacterium]